MLESSLHKKEAVNKEYNCELQLQRLYYKLQHRSTIKSRHAVLFSCLPGALKHIGLKVSLLLLTVVASVDDFTESFCVLQVDRIIFCVFLEVDYKIFKKKMGEFFPLGRYSNQVPFDFKKACNSWHLFFFPKPGSEM